jgi:hypothetical protein
MIFETGQIVNHLALPELGRARVEAVVGENVHLLFEIAGGGELKVFKSNSEGLALAKDQSPQGFPQRKLSASAGKRPSKSKAAPKASKSWNLDEAWNRFSAKYPAGFSDPKYIKNERDYKAAAVARCQELFSADGLARLKAANDPKAVDAAFAKVYEGLNLLHVIEWLQFRKALAASPASIQLVEAYTAIIAEGSLSEANFGHLQGSFDAMGLGKGKWTLLTLWPYLATNKGFVFVKPTITKTAAEGMNLSLNYDAKPNYLTYQSAIALYDQLWSQLEPKGAKDWVDIQSFIWVGWS